MFEDLTPRNDGSGITQVFRAEDDTIEVGVIQSQAACQEIADANEYWRENVPRLDDKGTYLAARVPIVEWWKWRKEWMERGHENFTWQTYATMKVNAPESWEWRLAGLVENREPANAGHAFETDPNWNVPKMNKRYDKYDDVGLVGEPLHFTEALLCPLA